MKADNTGNSKTTAEGQATGEKAAVGAAIALTVAVDQAEAMIGRNIDGGSESISIIADNTGSSETIAIASAAGGKAAKADGDPETGDKKVDDKTAEQLEKVKEKKTAEGKDITEKTSDKAKDATKKENAPKAETSEDSVSVAAAVGINTGISSARAYTKEGVIIFGGTLALKTTNNSTANAKADGSVTGKESTGIGAAVAVNAATVTNQATLGQGFYVVGGLDISATMRDIGESGKPDKTANFGAEATSGAGAANVGVAGSVAINIVDNNTTASINGGADISIFDGDINITAENNSGSIVKAIPHEKSDASGKTIGVGASVATNIGINHVIAEITDAVAISGTPQNMSLTATGKHNLETTAKAGSKGGISVTPVVAVTIADNQAIAKIGTGIVTLSGDLNLKANNTGNSKTTAEGQASGEKAAVGAAIAITVAVDQAEAMAARTIYGNGVSLVADNAGTSETIAIASAVGGKAAKEDGKPETGDKKVDDKTAEQLTKAGEKKTADGKKITEKASEKGKDAVKPEKAPKAETSEGSVSVAAAIGINTGISSARAYTKDGVDINARDTLAIKTTNNTTASAKADGSVTGKESIGIGAAVAVNAATVTNQATLGQGAHSVGGLDISATMRDIDESDKTDKTANFGAEAASGAGAANVGVAGSVAINIVDNNTTANIASGAIINILESNIDENDKNDGNISLVAENNSSSIVKAIPHEKSDASGKSVGVGASVATNIGINHVKAEIADGAAVTGMTNNVDLTATGKHSLETIAKAGAKGGIAVTPVVAVTIADNQAIARIGSGDNIGLSGKLIVKADNAGNSKTTAEGHADGEKAAVGAAIAITVAVDQAEAMTARSITSFGDGLRGVSFVATNAGISETAAFASAAGGKPAKTDGEAQAGDKKVDEKTAEQLEKVKEKKTAEGKDITEKTSDKAKDATKKENAPKAETSEGSVSVAAAVGINTSISSAKAYTQDGAAINTDGKLTIGTSNNTTAGATAEGKVVAKKDSDGNKAGVGAAVAINTATVTNSAKLGTGSHQVKGLELSADMRDIGTAEAPDKINNFSAGATSGAGATKIGVAGSMAINTVANTTSAEITSGAAVNAGQGDVTLRTEQQSSSEAKALPTKDGVSGGSVGVGASVAVNTVNDNTKASIGAAAGLTNAGAVKVLATANSDTTTKATGGAAGGIAIDAVGAITTLNQKTQAIIDTGNPLDADSIEVRSTNSGTHKATAIGDVKSSDIGIGASAAVITSNTLSSATIKRDINASGDITVTATAKRAFETIAEASAKGAKPLEDDKEKSKDLKNTSSKTLEDNADKQKGTKDGKTVDIAAAVAVTVIDDNVEAGILGGTAQETRKISMTGKLSITADNQSDFSSRGSGAALDPNAKVGIGVGVGMSIALNDTTAVIGDYTTAKAASDVTVAAKSQQNKSEGFANKLSAEGIAGAGSDKVGVAGALAVAYSDTKTNALIGNNVMIGESAKAAGNIAVTADNTSKLSAKGWSVAMGSTAGVGASVATLYSDNEYAATLGAGGSIYANSLNLQARNNKVTGTIPFAFNTDNLEELKQSLTASNLQTILGENNYYTEAVAGAASSNVAVTGATAVNHFQDKTNTAVGSDTSLWINGDVALSSSNDTTAKAFVTSVAATLGNAGVGLVSANSVNSGETTSIFGGRITHSGSVSVKAASTQDLGVFGLGGGLADTAGVAGVATVAVSENKVQAQIANNAVINTGTTDTILVDAKNDFKALNVAASLAVGKTAGVGAAIGTTNVTNDTQAWIGKKAVINAGQDISVAAAATENLHTIAAGGAGGGTVGVAGSGVVYAITNKTSGYIGNSGNVYAKGSIAVSAIDATDLNLLAGNVAAGGATGVGGAASVSVITKTTDAHIGKHAVVQANGRGPAVQVASGSFIPSYVNPTGEAKAPNMKSTDQYLSQADNKDTLTKERVVTLGQTPIKGVAVTAMSQDSIKNVAVGASGGASAGVAGSGSVSVADNTTTAYVAEGAKVNQNMLIAAPEQSVHIAATADYYHLGVGGAVAAGSGGGVGAGVDFSAVTNNTSAYVGKSAAVNASNNITITARAAEEILSIAAAGSAGGGAGLAGALTVNNINNKTHAYLAEASVVKALNNIRLAASDDTRLTALAGSAGLGFGGAGIGGSLAVNVVTKDTKAEIGAGTKVDALARGADTGRYCGLLKKGEGEM